MTACESHSACVKPGKKRTARESPSRRDLVCGIGRSVRVLGPNGAGRHHCGSDEGCAGLPDSGRISVCGSCPQKNPTGLKNEIGATLQSTSLRITLKVGRGAAAVCGVLQATRNPEGFACVTALVVEKTHAFYNQLSGAGRRDTATGAGAGMLNDPRVLFLIPTCGGGPDRCGGEIST